MNARNDAWLLDVIARHGSPDVIVSRSEDGPLVDDMVDTLRRIAGSDDENNSLEAQDRLSLFLAARARYRS